MNGETPNPSGLPELAAHLITSYYQKVYDPLFEHLTSDCLFIGAGSDVSYGVRSLAETIVANSSMPTFFVRDAQFHIIETSSPLEAIIVGFYTIYSDADHKMLSSEKQRITINCRWSSDQWRAYLVHTSNEWGPLDGEVAFPVKASKQTYRYVQDILRASKIRDEQSNESVALPVEEGTAFVNPTQIVYAEANAKKTVVHLINRTITAKLLLANVLELLPPQFSRIHRSYVVNRSHITALSGGEAVMTNGDRIPIPKRRRREVERQLARKAV